jgi:lysozyme family protein
MKETWERAINFVLIHEGGYVHDPQDPGGATNFGISQRSYPNCNIAGLTEEGAKEIYKRDYWDVLNLDDEEYEYPYDVLIFDSAVNVGISRTMTWMKESVDWKDFLLKRILHYTNLAKKVQFQKYYRGWMNRVMDLYREVQDV